MAIDLAKTLNYYGPEWAVMKAFLQEQRELKVRQLVGAADHDRSNVLRGEIKVIEHLLATEEAAHRAARGQ